MHAAAARQHCHRPSPPSECHLDGRWGGTAHDKALPEGLPDSLDSRGGGGCGGARKLLLLSSTYLYLYKLSLGFCL